MYCPNCKQSFEGKFCPECGAKLIEEPQANGISINLGDANAISGGLNMHDSHNVSNVDQRVINTTNHSTVTNNITQVERQKTEMEILQEKKTLYLNECKRALEDNVLEQSEIIALENLRMQLGLPKDEADRILESVRNLAMRGARQSELTPIAKIKLNQLTKMLQENEVKGLVAQIGAMEALANNFSNEDLQMKYYLVLAALKPELAVGKYEASHVDNYWMSFWTYIAYLKLNRVAEAENILIGMYKYQGYPEDNLTLLGCVGELIKGDSATAKTFLDAVVGSYSPCLQRLMDSIYVLLDPVMAAELGATEQSCAFYLVNLYGSEDPRIRAEREAKERAEAEAKAKALAEAEARAKAEEEARKIEAEAEAKRKAEEEARKKEAEAEAKNKLEEEVRRRAAEARAKAEEEVRRKIAEEKRKAEEEARRKIEEAKARAKAEEAQRNSEVLQYITVKNKKLISTSKKLSGDVILPETIEELECDSIVNRKQLTGITIPKTVKKIDSSIFAGCSNLQTIVVSEENPYFDSRGNCNAIIETATNKLIKGCKSTIIPTSVTSINKGAFEECVGLKGITIPDSVASIGDSAFKNCTNLTNIVLPAKLNSISYGMCEGCALTHVTIPDAVTTIDNWAFGGCNITNVTVPDSVTSLGAFAFYMDGLLKEISIKDERLLPQLKDALRDEKVKITIRNKS